MKSRSQHYDGAALALALAFRRPGAQTTRQGQRQRIESATDVVVHFGQPQPQTPDAVAGNAYHFLFPDDITIRKVAPSISS